MTNEQLCLLAQGGNNDAQNELIENVLPSLHAAAGKLALYYSGTSVESDDLIQIASIGLLRAIEKYDPESGNLFRTYASSVCQNAMMDHIRKLLSKRDAIGEIISLDDSTVRSEIENTLSGYSFLRNEFSKTPEQILIEKERIEEIHCALQMIPVRESAYLRYRFGFDDGIYHDREETAAHFHLSTNRAKSIEEQALTNFRLELPWWY
ncbi:MAG: sigma-70 family RNA polymerase sigma factor [Eubacterium sp.]|nr:sigma-70 family RNA polymerase sigma factor [Eubacterium sp.]